MAWQDWGVEGERGVLSTISRLSTHGASYRGVETGVTIAIFIPIMPVSSFSRQFKALAWKNARLRMRYVTSEYYLLVTCLIPYR